METLTEPPIEFNRVLKLKIEFPNGKSYWIKPPKEFHLYSLEYKEKPSQKKECN